MDTRIKIVPAVRAVSQIAPLSMNEKRIVTAAGWFDVLQGAHAERLAHAKEGQSLLIVFVYDDSADHPHVQDAWSRAQMVAALAAVDYVVICGQAEAASVAASCHLPPPLPIEDAMPRDIVADVLQRHKSE